MLTELGDAIDYSVVNVVSGPEELMEIRREIQGVFVSDSVKEYIVELVHRTREHESLRAGGSPRASRSLFQGSKSYAAMQGRNYVTPEDVQAIFLPVVGHRVTVTNEARYTKKTGADVLTAILEETPVPPAKERMFDHGAEK